MLREKRKFHPLLHSATLVEQHLAIQLSPLGVRPRQARVLNALHRMGAVSQAELAREFDLSEASMSTMTSRLIAAGHIARHPSDNNKSSFVLSLTKDGRGLLSDIHIAWAEVDRIIEAAIGPEKAEALATLTRELRTALGGRVAGKGKRTRNRKGLLPSVNDQGETT